METSQAEQKFQELWGAIGTSWGVNRTMAQIHALLLFNESPLSTEEIMERLSISRGNANTNIRALIDWSLV
ncbi:MAG: HTH domain-containing protein, partial [Candidatus Kapabacteria bacterium]|nr:HTH domain-containing protein [Candidatus Kapabacteria bacterium]